jgi:hypothetical protein
VEQNAMPSFRVTIRYGPPGQRYEMLDLEADSAPEALRQLLADYPAHAAATTDLIELRRQAQPEERGIPTS